VRLSVTLGRLLRPRLGAPRFCRSPRPSNRPYASIRRFS